MRIAQAYDGIEARTGSRWSLGNKGNQAMLAERRSRAEVLLRAAGMVPVAGRRVLEVGSGHGGELAWLLDLGAAPSDLVGVDLLPDRVASARRAHPEIEFHVGNAEHLEFGDGSFDLVLAVTIFSSILDRQMAANVASEIVRVLRPGGAILWYDVRYDSNSNPNVKAVPAARVRELFPSLTGDLRGVTLLPPVARRLGVLTPFVYAPLGAVPPLRSHLIGLLRQPER
jgi:SAM-dependent methyltransferase